MQDILKQLQEAVENFDNLFEVDGDGLGNPSVDVPPSTNKLKKDIKTKNGKVELVSVEDELFPKEGNAKEQFKQKVLDKINAMIQGTGTLEDLLNVVRAKQVKPVKEGFEGALEILEAIINEVSVNRWKEVAKNSIKNREKGDTRFHDNRTDHAKEVASLTNSNRSANSVVKAAKSSIDNRDKKYRTEYKKVVVSEPFGYRSVSDDNTRRNIERSDKAYRLVGANGKYKKEIYGDYEDEAVKEGFEGVIEILETALDAIKKSDYSDEKKEELRSKLAKAREEERKMADAKAWDDWTKGKRRSNHTSIARCETKNSEGERKTRLRSPNNNYRSGYSKVKPEWKQVEDSIKRHEKKAKLEEAQELLEEIINEVSVGKLAKAAENNFEKRRKEHDEAKKGLEKARDSYEEQSKKHPEDEQALYNSLDKLSRVAHKAGEKASHANDIVNLNLPKDSKVPANKLFDKADKTYDKRGKDVDKALEKGKGRGDKEFDVPMKKFSRAVDLAVADPVVKRRTNGGTNESFAEALELLEQILAETKSPEEVKEVAKKVLPNRKSEYLSKYADVLDIADVYGSENVPDGNIKDLDRAEKRYKRAEEKASLKESSYTEDTINKVAKKVLPQREADAKKAHDSLNHAMSINPHSMLNGKLSQRQKEVISNALNNAEKADNKLAHAKGILSKSKKEDSTGIKFDKILCALECLIDEATVGKLSNAVDNSVIKRQKEAEEAYNKVKTSKGADQVVLKAKADKAKKRLQHAQDLKMLRLPKKSGVSANKLFKSAEKSLPNRENNTIKNGKSGSYEKYKRAWNITDANPLKETLDMLEKLKEQINKNYEEEFKNEGLFVNDGRGDLIDDISKCLTKKTVKQHVVDTAKKLMKPKKVKATNEGFDSSEEKGYNEDKVLKLLEDIINEVSTKFTEPRIASVHGKVEKLEKQEEQEKDPVVKDKLNKERIQLQHKLNVVTDHVSNYHANQIKRDEAERNKRKNKKKE